MVRLSLTLLATVVFLTACSAATQSGEAGRNRDIITAQEMSQYTDRNARDLVRRLRPRWLRRGSPVIYIDGVRQGRGGDALATLQVHDIAEIRYRNASDATLRYGTDHDGGAIEVTTRR